jgi:hypothetical protein
MRISTLAVLAATALGMLTNSSSNAQVPVTTPGLGTTGRTSSAYGTSAGTGMTPMSRRGAGTSKAANPYGSSTGTNSATIPAGPSRYSPSSGGTATSSSVGFSGSTGTRRQLKRNSTPTLSPYLNLDAGFVDSDAGQYFGRVLPQQQFNSTTQQTQRAIEGVGGALGVQQAEIQSGLGTTGHTTSFNNLGSYFPPR